MKIGLIGNGKMGKEIFWFFFNCSHILKVACVEGAEEFKALVEKNLRKMNKRGVISDDELEIKLNSFEVSYDFNILSDCDLVIEAVFENEELKADIFSKVEKIVSEKCILATNTSSIPLGKVFSRCENKARCAGMHFFYPVKLSDFIELNTESFTSEETEKVISSLILAGDKKAVRFSGSYNMYLNKVISIAAAHSFVWKDNNNYSFSRINEILEDKFMTYSVFQMVDSVGIGIISASTSYFTDERCRFLLNKTDNVFKQFISDGCEKGPGFFLDFAEAAEKDNTFSGDPDTDNEFILSLSSVLLNDIVGACKNSGTDITSLKKAVEDVLNMSASFDEIYSKYGYDVIASNLNNYYKNTDCLIYKPYSKDEFENVFSK